MLVLDVFCKLLICKSVSSIRLRYVVSRPDYMYMNWLLCLGEEEEEGMMVARRLDETTIERNKCWITILKRFTFQDGVSTFVGTKPTNVYYKTSGNVPALFVVTEFSSFRTWTWPWHEHSVVRVYKLKLNMKSQKKDSDFRLIIPCFIL